MGFGVSAPKSHCLNALVHHPASQSSRKSSDCQIDAGLANASCPCIRPKSSGCSEMNSCHLFTPVCRANSQLNLTSVLCSSTFPLLYEESQGKPYGCVLLRSGGGPRLFAHLTLLKSEQGGVEITMSAFRACSNHLLCLSETARLCSSPPRSKSISCIVNSETVFGNNFSNQNLTSPLRCFPQKKYMTLTERPATAGSTTGSHLLHEDPMCSPKHLEQTCTNLHLSP